MATTNRQQISPLEHLLKQPQDFDFFQAVRLLKNFLKLQDSSEKYSIRFHTTTKSSFAVSYIDAIKTTPITPGDTKTTLFNMYVTFMGLVGPNGVLPQHYTELVNKKSHHNHTALQHFFGIFTHKILQLLYQVWEKNQLSVLYENQNKSHNLFYSQILASLSGLGLKSLRNKLSLSDEVIYHHSGLFSNTIHSAKTLEAILSEYFSLPICILQFQMQWLKLRPEDRTVLASRKAAARYNVLAKSIILGKQSLSTQSQFRIYIGPLNFSQFQSLHPEGELIKALKELVQLYVRYELSFDIQLELLAQEIPVCKLSANNPPTLGWNTWLFNHTPKENCRRIVIHTHH